jgi:hypothetical protein
VVKVGQGKAIVSPNPIQSSAIAYFDNDEKENCQMLIYDLSGVLQMQLSTRDEFFSMDLEGLLDGQYFYVILGEEGKTKAKGKILVAH